MTRLPRLGVGRAGPSPPRGGPQPVGDADVEPAGDDEAAADWAAWYSAVAFCRSDSAWPCAAKSPLRWASASAASALLMSVIALSSAGLDPALCDGGLDVDGGADDDGAVLPSLGAEDPLSAADEPAPAPKTWSSASDRVLA